MAGDCWSPGWDGKSWGDGKRQVSPITPWYLQDCYQCQRHTARSPIPIALQISEGFSEGMLQSGSVKPQVPPHALALYQQQITKAHESAREDVPPSKLSQSQQQAEKEQQQPSSSPRGKSRSPAVGDKEGRGVHALVRVYPHRNARCVQLYAAGSLPPLRWKLASTLESSLIAS